MSSLPRRQTISHCPYCALQCGRLLETEGSELVGQARWKKSPLTEGAVCSKGSTAWLQVRHPDRLRVPLVREGDRLVETDWETALDRAAEGSLQTLKTINFYAGPAGLFRPSFDTTESNLYPNR